MIYRHAFHRARPVTTVDRPGDWRDNAPCGSDPELFFPAGNSGQYADQIEEAKAVCRTCPVIRHCAEWALEHHEPAGIWGGLDENDRQRILRGRRRREAPAA